MPDGFDLALEHGGPRERATADGLYLMTKPDARAASALNHVGTETRARQSLTGWPTAAELLHVTLIVFPYDPDSDRQSAKIAKALSEIEVAPFRVAFDRLISFRGGARRPIVATADDGASGLQRLHQSLSTALNKHGASHGKGFTPHLTLLRDPKAIEETFIDPISWTVTSVELVLSLPPPRRHRVLARRMLTALA